MVVVAGGPGRTMASANGKLMLMMLSGSLRSPLTKQKRSQTDADDVVWFPSQQSTMQKRSPLMPMMLSGRACSTHATEKHRRTDADDVGLLAGADAFAVMVCNRVCLATRAGREQQSRCVAL